MADIRDNVLYSKVQEEPSVNQGDRFVVRIVEMLEQELSDNGDRDWLGDCEEKTSIKISEILDKSKRVASGLARCHHQIVL